MLLKIESVNNFDFKNLLIIASYNNQTSYLDILRLVNALYEMALTRATLNLITQRLLKKFFSIIFTDNKTSSTVSYQS